MKDLFFSRYCLKPKEDESFLKVKRVLFFRITVVPTLLCAIMRCVYFCGCFKVLSRSDSATEMYEMSVMDLEKLPSIHPQKNI